MAASRQPRDAVRVALLALDRDTAPWQVRPGLPEERADLVAEWRIVDARWIEIFAKAGLRKTFAVFMRLDAAACEVRGLDKSSSLEWRTGLPTSTFERDVQWGRQMSFDVGTRYGFDEQMQFGKVFSYRFTSSEIKRPLQRTATAMGWTWRSTSLGGF